MATMRRAVVVVLGMLAAATTGACSGGGSAAPDGGGGTGGGGGGGGGGDDAALADTGSSGETLDVPADFSADGQPVCPTAAGALAAAEAALLIDDFTGTGLLNERKVMRPSFSIRQQFDATMNAQFDVAPGIDGRCGAAAPGAAHIAGMPADAGATYVIVFSSGAAGAVVDSVDASAFRGITFRAAVGDARSSRVFPLRAGVLGSNWTYTVDVQLDGTAWKQIDVLWSQLDMSKAPGAPAFDPSKLNQLVLSLISGAAVDIFIDDIAFLR